MFKHVGPPLDSGYLNTCSYIAHMVSENEIKTIYKSLLVLQLSKWLSPSLKFIEQLFIILTSSPDQSKKYHDLVLIPIRWLSTKSNRTMWILRKHFYSLFCKNWNFPIGSWTYFSMKIKMFYKLLNFIDISCVLFMN